MVSLKIREGTRADWASSESGGFVIRRELDGVEAGAERLEELVGARFSEGWGWAGGEKRIAA